MGRVVVEVMPKPEILDPQGRAIDAALAEKGYDRLRAVRQGKRFELEVDGEVTDADLELARTVAEEVLANTVVEDVVKVEAQ